MNMAKRPVPKYDFKAFGAAIKAARTDRKESRKKVCDEMFISPRYLANIENNGQHPSLQIFFELMLRYNISVDQFLSDKPAEKNTQRRQLDALLDGISDTGLISLYETYEQTCIKNGIQLKVNLSEDTYPVLNTDKDRLHIFFEFYLKNIYKKTTNRNVSKNISKSVKNHSR